MDKWKKTLSDEVSPEFESRVLGNVRPLLKENAELFAKDSGRKVPWLRWQLFALPGTAVAVLVALAVLRLSTTTEPPAPELAVQLSPEFELAMDFAMFKDLPEIENLDLLQKLGDPETWPNQAPRKTKKAPKS